MSDGVHENRGYVLGLLASIGLDSKKFELHNLLPGEASAATNLGVNVRLFGKHVRWESGKARGNYVHECTLLFISNAFVQLSLSVA